ncbi:MAG: DegQ family serine endoprotease [Thermodesulfobacteriota bacterium]
MKTYGIKTILLVAFVSVLVGVAITASLDVTESTVAQNFWKESDNGEPPAIGPNSFVALAKKLSPAVVNISTTQVIRERQPAMPFPEPRTPFEDFFGEDFYKFFGEPEREFKRQSLGSGFIINEEGYILTNNHTIENATEIIVTLTGKKKKEYKAEVIGKDEKIDIALIKVDAGEDLPVVALGDSDRLEVGAWVVAIGNPFGLGGTVTAGIVSQKGRIIGAGPYDDFIQTDASINPGNSGGPLFDLKGEVVGINTAIIAGGQGIGFAIPVNMVKDILIQLKETGKITRGWIGVTVQEVTRDIAEAFGLEEPTGALISSVVPDDPADKAGIKSGDILVEFDDKEVAGMNDLPRLVAAVPPGKEVRVKVIRDGKEKKLTLTVAKKRDDGKGHEAAEEESESVPEKKIGLTVQPIPVEMAEGLGIEDIEGVLVTAVNPDSPAGNAGLKRGDIIKAINKKPVRGIAEYRKEIKAAVEGDLILFFVMRGKNTIFVTVKLAE